MSKKHRLEELGIISDEKLEDEFMQIVAQITGAYALNDFDGEKYNLLPELFSEYIVEPNESRCEILARKLKNISDNILELRDNVQLNTKKLKFLQKESR